MTPRPCWNIARVSDEEFEAADGSSYDDFDDDDDDDEPGNGLELIVDLDDETDVDDLFDRDDEDDRNEDPR